MDCSRQRKNGLVWKLSDEESRPKPCDGLSTPPLPSYLVIKFKDKFCFIRFEKIVELRNEGVISVSRSRAEEMSEKNNYIKIKTMKKEIKAKAKPKVLPMTRINTRITEKTTQVRQGSR